MSRPSSGGLGRSFLDELLANDIEKPNVSKRKSVRFLDNDEENGDTFGNNFLSSSSNREISGNLSKDKQRTLDSLDSLDWANTETANKQTTNVSKTSNKNTSKADWLGLGTDDDSDKPISQSLPEKSPKKTIDQKDDWLNMGLNARRSRQSAEATKSSVSQQEIIEDNSWLSIRKKVEDSKHKLSEQKDQKPSALNEAIDDRTVPNILPLKLENQNNNTINLSENVANLVNDQTSNVMLLQTQIKMLGLEKTYLQQTLDQVKINHSEELKIMTSLHEQQMRMTTDMYKRHEEMVQDERDRRINDLKSQLNQSEKDMEDLRRRYNERVQYLENEWEKEVERLKEMHSSSIKKLTEQHEQDLSRIRRIKEQEIESVNALQNHGSSLESLLSKWEKSAQQIEELHRSVITKQEEILKEKFTDIEQKNKRLDDVELNWHSLINELEIERNRCTDEQKKLYDIIEGQKLLLQTEKKRINEQLLELESDKKKLLEEKHKFEMESNYARDSIKKETDTFNEERIKLKDEIMKMEVQKKQLIIQEMECKQDLQKERDEINKMFRDIEEKRSELHREQSQLQRLSMSLQSEQHNFEQRKIMFDIEKVKMQDLALEIAKRAEELESLSEIALHEKREGNLAMDEADKFKKELDSKLEFIENSFAQLRKEDDRINREKIQIQEEWKAIKETKDTIVCNLCGSGLNRVKFSNGLHKTSLPDFNAFSTLYTTSNQFTGMQENGDRALLIWQIMGQQDAALLAEETAFVNALRKTPVINFQQNEQFLN